MNIAKLHKWLLSIEDYIHKKQSFSLEMTEGHLVSTPRGKSSFEIGFDNISLLTNLLRSHLEYIDYKTISPLELKAICEMLFILRKYLQSLQNNYRKQLDTFKPFENEILSLKLGGSVPPEVFQEKENPTAKFILANDLANKFLALGIKCRFDQDKGVAFPIEWMNKDVTYLFFDDLEKITVKDNQGKKITGYRYFYKNSHVFDTDSKDQLTEHFSILGRGISHFHAKNSSYLRAIDYRDPSSWNYKNLLEIRLFAHPHPDYFICLYSSSGLIYALSIEDGKIACPPKSFFPSNNLNQSSQFCFELSIEEMNSLISKMGLLRGQCLSKLKKRYLLDCLSNYFGWTMEGKMQKISINDLFLHPKSTYIKNYDALLTTLQKKSKNQIDYFVLREGFYE